LYKSVYNDALMKLILRRPILNRLVIRLNRRLL